MNELIRKSNENIHAAQMLIGTHKLFAPSIHCSYYSCVQLMIEVLINELGIRQDDIITQARNDKTGTHAFAANKIFLDIQPTDWNLARNLNNKIGSLKRIREISDYSGIKISEVISNKALLEAKEINKMLKQRYSIDEV